MDAKRLFFPQSKAQAKAKVESVLSHPPLESLNIGRCRSRWSLQQLLDCSPFPGVNTLSGLHKVLKRLGISLQRGRSWIRSPDKEYEPKVNFIKTCIEKGHMPDVQVVFLDEFTASVHASVSRAYAPKYQQPKAQRAVGTERKTRILATINCYTGQVTHVQRSKITVPTLMRFLRQLVEEYPQQTIYVIQDNWPNHFHPDIIEGLQTQISPFEPHWPKSWQDLKPSGKYKRLQLPVQLVPLPTYASWLNPIEKLWKWLKKDLMHHHPFAQDFKQLKEHIEEWLNGFNQPSPELLSFTGLLKNDGIFADAIFAN